MIMPVVALVLSAVGLARKQSRAAGVLGLVLSGLCLLFCLGFPLLMAICR